MELLTRELKLSETHWVQDPKFGTGRTISQNRYDKLFGAGGKYAPRKVMDLQNMYHQNLVNH